MCHGNRVRRQKSHRRSVADENKARRKRARAIAQYGPELAGERGARFRMCTSKASYPSDIEGIAAAIRASSSCGPMRVYQCPLCGCYHLTTRIPEDVLETA